MALIKINWFMRVQYPFLVLYRSACFFSKDEAPSAVAATESADKEKLQKKVTKRKVRKKADQGEDGQPEEDEAGVSTETSERPKSPVKEEVCQYQSIDDINS